MPNNITQIPALRVPIIDPRTGLISREWYLFFFNLFNLVGSGSNAVSLSDVQVGPPDSSAQSEQINIINNFNSLAVAPSEAIWEASQDSVTKAIQALNVAPIDPEWLAQQISVFSQLQGLAVAPANTPQVLNGRYGVFHDTTTQTAAAINTAYPISFNATDLSNGVYIGSPTSRVYVDRPGVYNFQFSAQLDQASASAHEVYIWADINGTSQPNSATQVTLVGNNAASVAAWNFVYNMNAGDYFRLMWSTSDTACQILAAAAAAPVPAIPSVILTVTDNIGITR